MSPPTEDCTLLLITSNVGSLFEGEGIEGNWLKVIGDRLLEQNAHVAVLHMQETGGKRYHDNMHRVEPLMHRLHSLVSTRYATAAAFLDVEHAEHDFTALSTLVLFRTGHEQAVERFNFSTRAWTSLPTGLSVIADGLSRSDYAHKKKFPRSLWPDIKWGRKGFLCTRWRIHNLWQLDFINVHLFHDDSNIPLVHENPLLYSENRKRALDFTLKEVAALPARDGRAYTFVFGDFNFRLNAPAFLSKVTDVLETPTVPTHEEEIASAIPSIVTASVATETSSAPATPSGFSSTSTSTNASTDEPSTSSDASSTATTLNTNNVVPKCRTTTVAFQKSRHKSHHKFRLVKIEETTLHPKEEGEDDDDERSKGHLRAEKLRRTVSAIEFRKEEPQRSTCVVRIERKTFDYIHPERLLAHWPVYKEDDRETAAFPHLHEFPIQFAPTYPWSETADQPVRLEKTRMPAWCDRVLLDSAAWTALRSRGHAEYTSLGDHVCTGDHKPVMLALRLPVQDDNDDEKEEGREQQQQTSGGDGGTGGPARCNGVTHHSHGV